MATVVISETAAADLELLMATQNLPETTRQRVRASLEPLVRFPLLGPALTGRWGAFRFVLGPWAWMLLVYVYDEVTDVVSVVTIQDARSARSATSNP